MPSIPLRENQSFWSWLVVGAACLVAIVSARNYAGSWNDGSRLATVECLVDKHSLAIDDSMFVQAPAADHPAAPACQPFDDPELQISGTGDKLFIHGHYYSDKSPVPALLMAGWYQILQWTSGLSAQQQTRAFCYWMTLGSSGLAYVVAVWCIFQLGLVIGLPLGLRLVWTASFALATVALPYVRHANNHILLLAVAAALMLQLARLATESLSVFTSRPPTSLLYCLGLLAGLGYSIDLGAGPVLLVCTAAVILYRCRSWLALARFGLGAMPLLILHHLVNYQIGGTFKPANAVPQYFNWPGCSFNAQNMTGAWNHESILHFLVYAAALLVGKRGFIGHNLPLYLLLGGVWLLIRQPSTKPPITKLPSTKPPNTELAEILLAVFWPGGAWLAYALSSTNYSGLCCSIRWFVPLLAPAYYLLALLLRDFPTFRRPFLILSVWGALLAAIMWWQGPWIKHMVPFFWTIQAAALLTCYALRQRKQKSSDQVRERIAADAA